MLMGFEGPADSHVTTSLEFAIGLMLVICLSFDNLVLVENLDCITYLGTAFSLCDKVNMHY
jgi:hypothetical protein